MNKKQGLSLFTDRASFKQNRAIGSKKRTLQFIDLTLFKPDIETLIQLFQNHLQDVEIVIDDQRILESIQLEQFESSYQAQSLRMRGYWPGTTGEDTNGQRERLLIELNINNLVAVLTSWNTVEKSEFIGQFRKVLSHHYTFVQQILQMIIFGLFLNPLFLVTSLLEHQRIASSLQFLIAAGIGLLGILAIPAFILLFAFIVTRLKLEARNFLFPGKMTTTQTSHRFSMVGRLVVALVLLIVFDGILIIAFLMAFRLHWG